MEAQDNQSALHKELEERNAFIEAILQNLPIGIAVNRIDDGKATVVNKRFGEIYGWSDKDLTDISTFFQKVFPDETYRNKITPEILEDIQSGDPAKMNWNGIVVTTQTGEQRIINAKNIPLYDQNLMISTVIDVTKEFNQAAEIQRSKENKEALINGSEELIWSVDKDLRIITANNAFQEGIKIITGEYLQEGDSILIKEYGEEINSKWKGHYSMALKGERYTIKEPIFNPLKESTEYWQITFNPMYNAGGELFGVACYSKDITEDTLNLLALENAKTELEKIMDSSMDMICCVDENSYFLKVSAASETILGYRPDELIGKLMTDFIYPEDLEKTMQMAAYIMAGHNMTNVENRYIHKDGSLVPLFWSARWDPKDKIRYGIARDATEKKKNEAALITSEKIYRYLFDNNPLPIAIWDFAEQLFIDCNEAACEKYGYTREEFLKLTINELRPADDVQLIQDAVKSEESYGNLHKRNWRHKNKRGEIMYVDVTGHLMDYYGKKVSLVLLNDVTESRYYHELDRLEKNVLEMNAGNDKSLSEVIDIYLSGIESLHPGMVCSLLEKKGDRLFNLASPSLPKLFLKDIEGGIEIGNNMGSCGTAAFLKEKVIVPDISNDIRWSSPCKEIVGQYHFKTCWSYPILDGNSDVMATFSIYYREVKVPTESEENTIQRAGHFLQVILESYQQEKALKISNERFEYAAEATSDIIWDWNLATNEVYYSSNIQKLFGHNKYGINTDNLPFYYEHVHPDDRERVVLYPDQVKYGTMRTWTQDYRFRKANGEYAFVLDKGIVIRDEQGTGVRMIGAIQDVTTLKRQNERLTEIALINAHEIRRPVATILGLLSLFKETIESEPNRELVKHLESVTQELDTVIRRIIDKTVT